MEEMKGDYGIEETLELLKAAEIVSVGIAKAAKDGDFNMKDIPVLLELLEQSKNIIKGIKGVDKIPDEFKDLGEREIAAIVMKVFEIVRHVQSELKK